MGQDLIRTGLRKVTGQEWRLLVEKIDEPAANGAAPPPALRRETRQKDLLALPLFQKAVKVLGAQLVRVEDGFDPNAVPEGNTEETDDETPVPETEDE